MAWDSTKSTAADPDNPTADEQTPASEWNEMITYLKARVGNTLFDAYSILYADADDTPAALTVAASRIIGRKATGGIAAMTAAELISLVGQWGDADKVDGCDAGWDHGDVFKLIDTGFVGAIYYSNATGIDYLNSATSGHQLTTNGVGTAPTWAAPSDLIFSDTHCPKCGKEFQDGDDLILHVIGHNEIGDLLTIPMHQSCTAEPKKTVMIKRKVVEDRYILDEDTGESVVQRVQKMQEKTITKHKMKEGYVLDNKSGKALKIDVDGKVGKTKHNLSEALEIVEETISEVVYEDVEFEL